MAGPGWVNAQFQTTLSVTAVYEARSAALDSRTILGHILPTRTLLLTEGEAVCRKLSLLGLNT